MEPNRRKRVFKGKFSVKGVFVFLVCAYIAYIFIGQQRDLNANGGKILEVDGEIQAAAELHENLLYQREFIDTPEYKEKVARERGSLVMPDEVVFIDPFEKN